MKIKYKVDSIEREHVPYVGYRYEIKAQSLSTKIALSLSTAEYTAIVAAIGPITMDTVIPVSLPGEVKYEDE